MRKHIKKCIILVSLTAWICNAQRKLSKRIECKQLFRLIKIFGKHNSSPFLPVILFIRFSLLPYYREIKAVPPPIFKNGPHSNFPFIFVLLSDLLIKQAFAAMLLPVTKLSQSKLESCSGFFPEAIMAHFYILHNLPSAAGVDATIPETTPGLC